MNSAKAILRNNKEEYKAPIKQQPVIIYNNYLLPQMPVPLSCDVANQFNSIPMLPSTISYSNQYIGPNIGKNVSHLQVPYPKSNMYTDQI